MNWTTAADFDLAAAYETTDGKQGIVYYGELGKLQDFPFMELSGDDGVNGIPTKGSKEEILQINRLDTMNYVWLFCWDYNMVQRGQAARFKQSDVVLTIVDVFGNSVSVNIDTGEEGNVCCIATIDNSHPEGARFINYSQVGTLKGLKTLEQLVAVARQFVI
jgi:tellurite resistance protein TerA